MKDAKIELFEGVPELDEHNESGFSITPDSIIDMIEAPSDGVRANFDDAVATAASMPDTPESSTKRPKGKKASSHAKGN